MLARMLAVPILIACAAGCAEPPQKSEKDDGAKLIISLADGSTIRAKMAAKDGGVWKILTAKGEFIEVLAKDVKGSEPVPVVEQEQPAPVGTAAAQAAAEEPAENPIAGVFKHRGEREAYVKKYGGDKDSEAAVDAGLAWLAKHQKEDGRWDSVLHGGKHADVALTGLALLAFLGAGHTENAGEWKENVTRAVAWLKSLQHEDGKIFKKGETHGPGYHHSIAGLAMVEAAGMGRIPETLESAQKAVDYSCNVHQHRNDKGERGGWRYEANQKGDTSVTGWFVMQLKSAKIAGLKVDPDAFDGAIKFLDQVEHRPTGLKHLYGYLDPNSVGHRRTAIGCLSRQFMGWEYKDLQVGIAWFVQDTGMPKWDTPATATSPDLYYWYYATLCLFQQGGPLWTQWNRELKTTLVKKQRKEDDLAGSWDPQGAYAGYWGRVGQTALACLCLEVYYRYPRP